MKTLFKNFLITFLVCSIFIPNVSAAAKSNGTGSNSRFAEAGMQVLKQKSDDNDEQKPYYSITQKWVLIGDTRILYLHNLPEDDSMEITCKSSDTDIVSVGYSDEMCKITGISAGNATITITIKEAGFFPSYKYKLTCKVTVSPRAASIKFRKSSSKITNGKKAQLEIILRPSITKEKPVYESSNIKIAQISPAGVVKAKSTGTCYITARISNGKTARCKIIVQAKKKKS